MVYRLKHSLMCVHRTLKHGLYLAYSNYPLLTLVNCDGEISGLGVTIIGWFACVNFVYQI